MSVFYQTGKYRNTDEKKKPSFIPCNKCGGTARKLFYQTKTSRISTTVGICTTCNILVTTEKIEVRFLYEVKQKK